MSFEHISAKSLWLTAPGQLQWVAEALPPLGAHDVLVQTQTGAISIGSELPVYSGTSRASHPVQYPRRMGYENIGIVLACGFQVQTVRTGNRVVAFYGHRTHAVVPETKVIVVPDDIADPLAILVILSCDAAKGVHKIMPIGSLTGGDLSGGDLTPTRGVTTCSDAPCGCQALITGAGTMGLLTLFMLKACGCDSVDVVEPEQRRHALAYQLGASSVYLPQDLLSTNKTYQVAFECSSRDEAFALLQKHMQHNGRICITADGNIEPFRLTPTFHEKELCIVGSSDGWDYHKHAAWYFHELRQHPTALEQLFEQEIPYHELIATFEQLAESKLRPVKVLIHYEPSLM